MDSSEDKVVAGDEKWIKLNNDYWRTLIHSKNWGTSGQVVKSSVKMIKPIVRPNLGKITRFETYYLMNTINNQ